MITCVIIYLICDVSPELSDMYPESCKDSSIDDDKYTECSRHAVFGI